MLYVKAFLFALILHTTVSPLPRENGRPGEVPLAYGVATYLAAVHHGVDPWVMGALFVSEHRGRDYSPTLEGRYNGGGEMGLYQLKAVWAVEATERCNADLRRGHHRYADSPPCLWIGPQDTVYHTVGPRTRRRKGARARALSEAFVNIEAAAIAFAYLQAKHREQKGFPWDWRAMFKCAPRAWNNPQRTTEQRASLRRCARSVRRVTAWQSALEPGAPHLTLRK